MLILEKPLQHWITNFYGYGSWQAKFWFVSYEDGGGDLPEEVAEKLNYFSETHKSSDETLCDIREMYRNNSMYWDGPKAGLFKNLFEYRFGPEAALNNIWKNLILFEYGYNEEELPDLLTYQKMQFASPVLKNEALIKLYPLPSPHHHGWYYSWLDMPQFPFLKSRALYEQHVYTSRIQNILQKIRDVRPRLVLMYGMNNINDLKKSVQLVFPEAKFKMIKAEKRVVPQHHRADLGGTTLLITTQIPTLRHNRVETGFDWMQFGQRVKGSVG